MLRLAEPPVAPALDPLIGEADVIGLYVPDVAAAASKQTACDPGSGPTRIDD